MIVESERGTLVVDDQHQLPLSQIDHEMSTEFGAFIAMHQEIRDKHVHLNCKMVSCGIWGGKMLLDVCLDLLECLCELFFKCLNYCNKTI
jgi:3-hydroxymyristoyl/3-hydroxydecanoyl-(acyl carrier protein) dehydratase